MVSLTDYAGREQSYVKHLLLESYLDKLIHKIASVYDEIVYVDGFAGPWQNSNENFDDTSFGIALNALRRAKATWKQHGRDVRMSAFLVERDTTAHGRLAQVTERYPELTIKTHCADFLSVVPIILQDVPPKAFSFCLIDPKGWHVPLKKLAPLLSRPNSEVIFNFMFEFINRAAAIGKPEVVAGLDELIPLGDWRSALTAEAVGSSPEYRKAILIEAFSDNLRRIGNYPYVAETAVLRPTKDRTLYCLFYGTRSAKGIEAFRASQLAALAEQSRTRAAVKLKHTETRTRQAEIFQSLHEMGRDQLLVDLQSERQTAIRMILELIPVQPDAIKYDDIWPKVLARNIVSRVNVNTIVATLRAEEQLLIPDWEERRRVPQGWYHLQRPKR